MYEGSEAVNILGDHNPRDVYLDVAYLPETMALLKYQQLGQRNRQVVDPTSKSFIGFMQTNVIKPTLRELYNAIFPHDPNNDIYYGAEEDARMTMAVFLRAREFRAQNQGAFDAYGTVEVGDHYFQRAYLLHPEEDLRSKDPREFCRVQLIRRAHQWNQEITDEAVVPITN